MNVDIANKGTTRFDPVTNVDRAIEQAMRESIAQTYPDDAVTGEELAPRHSPSPRRWSIDPVDGTRVLLCGLPSWAVLVGLLEGDRHIAGMIDLPDLDELLIASDNQTTRNGAAVTTSACTALAKARLATTDPFLFSRQEADAFNRVRTAVLMTRCGLDALGYARIATGGLDLVIESGLMPHDYDAVIPVVRGAGGHVGDWRGGSDFASGRIVAAATKDLYDEAVATLGF